MRPIRIPPNIGWAVTVVPGAADKNSKCHISHGSGHGMRDNGPSERIYRFLVCREVVERVAYPFAVLAILVRQRSCMHNGLVAMLASCLLFTRRGRRCAITVNFQQWPTRPIRPAMARRNWKLKILITRLNDTHMAACIGRLFPIMDPRGAGLDGCFDAGRKNVCSSGRPVPLSVAISHFVFPKRLYFRIGWLE